MYENIENLTDTCTGCDNEWHSLATGLFHGDVMTMFQKLTSDKKKLSVIFKQNFKQKVHHSTYSLVEVLVLAKVI